MATKNISSNYTIIASDAENTLAMTNTSAITITIPTDKAANIKIGAIIALNQEATGQVTIKPAKNVKVQAFEGATKLGGQYAAAYLEKKAANTWRLVGNLKK